MRAQGRIAIVLVALLVVWVASYLLVRWHWGGTFGSHRQTTMVIEEGVDPPPAVPFTWYEVTYPAGRIGRTLSILHAPLRWADHRLTGVVVRQDAWRTSSQVLSSSQVKTTCRHGRPSMLIGPPRS